MNDAHILVIDDEENIRLALEDILTDEGYTVFTAEDGIEGLRLMDRYPVDVVLLDLWLPHRGGMEILEELRAKDPSVEIVIISGHGTIETAVRAVKQGAFDFLEKPLSLEKVLTVVRNALRLRELQNENTRLRQRLYQEDEMIGTSPAMQVIRERIAQSAASDSRILILGENGTGKELVAREIHRRSRRASGPFVEVNCAAIPDTLLESELFGHEKGAFTGALSSRRGKFELAHNGTLFLDEVADMSLSAQAKVLRVLQELQFTRIGGERVITVDVRLIAATNKDLEGEVKSGRFREDLYYRLNVIPIYVPPLRERVEDIPTLIDYFLKKFTPPGETPKRISREGLTMLKEYPWPGNIRELKNFVERLCILSDEAEISPETIKEFLGEALHARTHSTVLDEYSHLPLGEARDAFEKRLIEKKLEEHDYNISRTAASLGIYPSNLHSKIKKFGIKIPK
ncbi:two component, sigma54 specific, transcriptional regulator, Fis family [Spirochaeta thermophila DSM 6578]|uniref:Two component, sigma54 specific, transcriptional regulator, Fis family n=1 Tax=Winmispira thermophila (strain ATCC 700085 / DSM 6578 / Z-1203) TaxID=869211 RepID=G0GG25_WINT7|nr:sigma-54 dependent transcriptional regulator [Spirochaeta thermophila]AEJ62501.1 two component, sigma54 specific, transcriptional regulator, Fis family [Spirochaeta thermophila DSM 6578]